LELDQKKAWIVDSQSYAYQSYIICLTIVILYIIIGLPLKIAFFTSDNVEIWIVLDIVASIVIFCDMVLHFFLPCKLNDQFIYNRKTIARVYVQSYLAVDLLCIFPFYSVVNRERLFMTGILSSIKIIKLYITINQFQSTAYKHKFIFWERMSRWFILKKSFSKIFNIMAITFMFTHIAACCWAFLLVETDYHNSWIKL
jgi:hypothetical protein